jgi:MFS family permease
MFAALIFPTTLSVITNTFEDRKARAGAVGAWGAVGGLGVAVGALVYTIIEAPNRGWLSAASLLGFAVTEVAGVAFVQIERRSRHPMLDVSLFAERAFSAASGSVTVAFFSLFGFIFLITQYMQFIRGYGTLSTGLRILPVALSLGAFAVLGANLAARLGTRVIVCTGLVLLGASFLWIAQDSATVSYGIIVIQMVMLGSGIGLISTPATECVGLRNRPAARARRPARARGRSRGRPVAVGARPPRPVRRRGPALLADRLGHVAVARR